MTDLSLDLDDTDFERLATLGRSLIPTLARTWTDHNTHDPGIMLIELLAWIADAQIYSLSRLRRDERRAYARLLGIELRGPRPATGLVWPESPSELVRVGGSPVTLLVNTAVKPNQPLAPAFYLTHSIELTGARLVAVSTRFADGSAPRDWTRANAPTAATFKPFGDAPSAGDRLVLRFEGQLVEAKPPVPGVDPLLSIGVAVIAREASAALGSESNASSLRRAHRLRVALEDSAGERALELVEDTTEGLLHSGVLLLRVGPNVRPYDASFAITIRSAHGVLLRSPRLQCIAPNVLPIVQRKYVDELASFSQVVPSQQYVLSERGFVFPTRKADVTVRVGEQDGQSHEWKMVADLNQCGPDDRASSFDRDTQTITFGNGINGRLLPLNAATSSRQQPQESPKASVRVSYEVSDGARGNLPKDLIWSVASLAAKFKNLQPTSGGADGLELAELRAMSRQDLRTARPLVTRKDLESAARALSDLQVARAVELPATLDRPHVRGTRILVAIASRDSSDGNPQTLESPSWLEEVRARLAPRLPLGERLEVIAPRYTRVQLTARLTVAPNLFPDDVLAQVVAMLEARFASVAATEKDAWPVGRDLSVLELKGWIRKVDGVARVCELVLRVGEREVRDGRLRLGPAGLPALELTKQSIQVECYPQRVVQ